jgi:thioredoxin 1
MEKTPKMTPLLKQELFEAFIGRVESDEPIPSLIVVYFTAKWCGACKRLDLNRIMETAPKAAWYKCDIDENEYTAGFCGIRSIPTFLIIKNKQIIGQLGDSRTDMVINWLKRFVE